MQAEGSHFALLGATLRTFVELFLVRGLGSLGGRVDLSRLRDSRFISETNLSVSGAEFLKVLICGSVPVGDIQLDL